MSIPSKYQDAQRYSEKPKALSSLRTGETQGMGTESKGNEEAGARGADRGGVRGPAAG